MKYVYVFRADLQMLHGLDFDKSISFGFLNDNMVQLNAFESNFDIVEVSKCASFSIAFDIVRSVMQNKENIGCCEIISRN